LGSIPSTKKEGEEERKRKGKERKEKGNERKGKKKRKGTLDEFSQNGHTPVVSVTELKELSITTAPQHPRWSLRLLTPQG
jgi:hypothetical protein